MNESRLKRTDLDLLEATQRLAPEERLEAFVTHCRLVMDLYAAGKRLRDAEQRPSR